MMKRFASYLFVSLMLTLTLNAKPARAAGGVVGTGTPASCTEVAFDTVFFNAQNTGGGVITFNCGPAPHAIVLNAYKPITTNTELQGNNLITLSGGNNTSIFQVSFGRQLRLTNITLTRAYGFFGAIENFGTTRIEGSQLISNTATGSGGAVLNHGDLVVVNSTVAYNESKDAGGGIHSDGGTVRVTNSQFIGNFTINEGGGLLVRDDSVAFVDASLFRQNKATYLFAEGGAIASRSILSVTNSTFLQNSSSRGGAISVIEGTTTLSRTTVLGNWGAYGGGIRQSTGLLTITDSSLAGNGIAPNGTRVTTGGGALSWEDGTASLTNVTLSGNWASYGGGFDHTNGTTTLVNVTLSGNNAVGGGAIDTGGGTIHLTNATIVNNSAQFFAGGISNRNQAVVNLKNVLLSNPGSKNCNAGIPAANFSFSSDISCSFGSNRDNVKLAFGLLANNGGGMLTHMPLPGNPGIDAGSGCPSFDQRGVTRPQGLACDAGAVEYAPGAVTQWQYAPVVLR